MNATATRLAICAVLFATWVTLVVFRVQGDEEIIDVIKYALAILGGYHAGDRINVPATQMPSAISVPDPTTSTKEQP